MNCLPEERTIKQAVETLTDMGFYLNTEYTSALDVSSIKDWVLSRNIPPFFLEATDMFVFFKGQAGSFLMEFHKGCTHAFLGMDPIKTLEFLKFIGDSI